MSEAVLKVTQKVHFIPQRRGRRSIQVGELPVPSPVPQGTIPRVSRLMAMAIRFDSLIRSGMITDRADLARFGHVSRARVTQIMNLLHLAPDIQEAILYLPRTTKGRDIIHEHDLRPVAALLDWAGQRREWLKLAQTTDAPR